MPSHYEMLINVLRLAASEPEIQIKSLPDFVLVTDEVATNFDDVYQYKDELILGKMISIEMSELLDEINEETEFMSDNKVGWRIEELKDSHHWIKIREIAKKILLMMGESLSSPNLNWIKYIKAKNSLEDPLI